MRRRALSAGMLVVVVFLASCGSGTAPPPTNPGTPMITALSPATVPAGTTEFALAVQGSGLDAVSSVHFGADVLTPVESFQVCSPGSGCKEEISVIVPASDVASVETVNVFVSSSTNSNTISFQVAALPPAAGPPVVQFISPGVAVAGGPSFTLLLSTANIGAGVTVNFGALALTPQLSPECPSALSCFLEVTIPASAIATAQVAAVTATNPGPNGGTSNAASFYTSAFPILESVDNSNPPVPANSASTHSAAASAARFVAFDSTATNLIPGTVAGHSQIYERDNCFGAPASCTPNTTLISVATGGGPGAGGSIGSSSPATTGDGRFIAFQSDDTNLTAAATQPVMQIYVRDTCQGIFGPVPQCIPQTLLVSASPSGAPGNAPSTNPVLAANFPLLVAFQSAATNLLSAPVAAGAQQIYLAVPCLAIGVPASCQPGVAIQSADVNGNPGDKDSTNPSLSSNGQYLSFESLADNLAPNTPGNSFRQIYTRTSCPLSPPNGPPVPQLCNPNSGILPVSVDANGNLSTGDSSTPAPSLFGAVVFATRAPNLLPSGVTSQQIVVHSECYSPNGPCPTPQVFIASLDQNGQPGQGDSSSPSVSLTGVAFTSLASLLPGVSGKQVYQTRVCLVAAPCMPQTTVLVSTDSQGNPIGGDFAFNAGLYVSFVSTGASSAPGVPQVLLAASPLGLAPR